VGKFYQPSTAPRNCGEHCSLLAKDERVHKKCTSSSAAHKTSPSPTTPPAVSVLRHGTWSDTSRTKKNRTVGMFRHQGKKQPSWASSTLSISVTPHCIYQPSWTRLPCAGIMEDCRALRAKPDRKNHSYQPTVSRARNNPYATASVWDGIYLHQLERDGCGLQGNTNPSHGCLNLNGDNAMVLLFSCRRRRLGAQQGGPPLQLRAERATGACRGNQWRKGSAQS